MIEGPTSAPASRHTSRRGSVSDPNLKRHDSGVSMHSHRSRHSSTSKTSTAKPSRRGSLYESAANVPLPSSKAQSYISAAEMPLPASRAQSYITAADMPLPVSHAASYYSAAQVPVPPSRTNGGYTDVAEESDGLDDMRTVVPEDSISCVDFSAKPKKSTSSSKSSRHSSKHSEAPSERTVRPAKTAGSKHSAQTLPMRPKDDYYSTRGGRRSILSYA